MGRGHRGRVGQPDRWHPLRRRAAADRCRAALRAADPADGRGHRGWLERRREWSIRDLVDELRDLARPRVLVEKSPSTVTSLATMQRIEAMYPDARYVHLVRHPVGQGESILRLIAEVRRQGPVRPWMEALAGTGECARPDLTGPHGRVVRGQNAMVVRFLTGVPARRRITLRGEDVLSDPVLWCHLVAQWLGASQDPASIEAMLHPERSPFSGIGPVGAPFGNDINFLRDPVLRPDVVRRVPSLDAPVPWGDGQHLAPHVRDLATWLGYR